MIVSKEFSTVFALTDGEKKRALHFIENITDHGSLEYTINLLESVSRTLVRAAYGEASKSEDQESIIGLMVLTNEVTNALKYLHITTPVKE